MKKTRRWLALLLAVILVGSNALYQIGTSMSASETETTAESGQQDDSAAVPETQDQDTASLDQQKDTGGVQVQEVTPQTQQEKTNSQSEAAKTQQVQPAQNNTSVSDQNTQAVSGTEPAQETPEEKTYHVTIQKSDVDGGTIKAWGSDGNKADVTYNSENKYVKEVKEGEEFNFEITAKDTYKVAKVTDQNGTTIEPKAVNNNVYKYEVKNITAERTYSITYVKEEVKKAESTSNGDQHKSDDEQSEDADDDGEPAAKVQAAAEEVMTDFYVGADRTSVTVGDTVNVKAIIKPDNYSNKKVTWESSDDDTATVDENGVVTTLQTGIVTITGTSEANAEYTDSVVIQINPVSVTGITINGYNKDYLTKNESVQLTAVAEPQNAEDKELTWSSSNKNVATVDQTGNVTAKGQGTAVIRVENTASGKYATQEVTVYEKEPQSVTVHVWVTNQDEGKTYIFYLPEDGTVVNASSVHKSVEGYVTTGDIRVGNWISAGSSWTNIKKVTTAKRFRYNNGNIQYSTSDSGNNWKNVGAKSIVDFCESVRKGDSSSDTDVKVILGDWPYNDGVNPAHNRQTIRIEVVAKDDADNTTVVYNSGTMRYDNASNGEYGKIKFNCDESRYEVEKVLVYKNDAGTGNVYKTYKEIPTGGINVSFTTNATNHYLVRAIVKPKKFNVVYDANGGENAPNSETLTAVNGQKVTVATAPQPTRTDYIFAGWEYNGTTYYGGESFEMPPSNVTFVAKWIPASTAISYKSNNTDWGTVSRSHEIVKDGATAKGSVANAKEGYEFVEWQDANGKQVSTDNFYRPDEKAGSYTAIFQAKTYNVTYQFTGEVPDGAKLPEIGKHKFDSEVKVAEVADVPGYTFGGWTSQDVTLKDGTFTMPAKNVTLTGTWKQKAGKFGYYLSLKNASWKGGMPDNLEVSGTSGQGLPKYAEKVHYSYGDKYKVIANVPTAEGHAFIGWLDKERGDQSAAIRKAGDELTYIYKTGEGNKDQAYTLDALWASIAAKGGTYTYNGSSRQITADIAINEGLNLNAEYVEQAKKFIKTGKMEYSTDNKNWSEKNPGFTDAGTYTVYVRQNVTVGKTTTTLQSSAQIVINPRNVELTSATASKMYDGKALTKKEVTVSGDGFITGEGATYNVTGSQKVVGSSENTFTYTLTKATKEKNYNITTKNGTLTVTNRDAKYEITVKANSTTGTYNGTEYSAIGLESTTFTVDGNVYTVEGLKTEDPVKKDAGTYTNNITGTAVVKDADGNDVTNQFLVKTVNGSLVINKATVTLKSADLSKEYDGEALVNGNAALATETGWAEGEGADYAFTGSQTLVGSSSNTFSYALRANTNINNYTISKTEGTLTVTNRSAKYEITVKANSTNTTYNGKTHSAKGVESNEFTINGKKYTVSGLTTGDPEQKNAGTYPNNITGTAIVKDAKGNDVTEQFAVKVENGSLVINKAAVTLKSADLSKEYDGKALVNGKTALATETGWAEGEGADYTFTGSQTLVGNSSNTFSYALKANTNSDNYTINKTEGTLSVTNRKAKYTVTVTANSTTATYNGTEYSATGMQGTTFAIDGVQYTVEGLTTENPTQKDAGTYSNNVLGTAIVKDAEGNDVTEQFAVNTVNGSLVINKATVTLKSADLSKEYDGEALVNGTTALATETGWAAGEGADYAFTGSQTLVGSSSNTFSYALRANTNINNYTISKTEGTLTVTNRSAKYEITVKANSTNTTYNGKTHSAKGVESNEFTINGKKYTVSGLTTGDPEQKNAGTYPNNITGTAIVKDAKGNDVTEQFAVKVENGSLVINKAAVTLKSADLSKEYDGKALVNGKTALATETGWAEGEGADYTFTGSQTLVGNSSNTFSYALRANTNINNYTISKTEGTLTVTNRSAKYEITVKANSTNTTYNGKTHSAKGVESNEFTINGKKYTVSGLTTGDPEQKNAGTYPNNITGTAIVKDAKGNDVTEQFAVKVENGSLVINKAEVTLKSANLNKVYDGEALVNGNAALETENGWAESDKAGVVYEFTGSQTEVGSSENKFAVKWNDTVKESNYNVSIEFGTLTVTEQSIVPGPDPENPVPNYKGIKIDDPSDVPYDGKEHKWTPTVTDAKDNKLTEGTDYEVSYNKKDYTNVTGAIKVTITGKGNYTGSVIKSYQITPASVSIKTNGAERVYNGKPLTAAGTIEGLVNNETVDFKVTGSQTEVGNSKNTYTLKWTGTAKESNYQIVSEEIGTLVVTENAEELVVTTTGGTFTYTGLAHGATVTVSELPEGYTLETAESSATATDVTDASGVAATADRLVIRNAAGEDVTAKLNIKKVDGTIVVTPAALTITTPDANKVYDGNALTAAGTISGFVNGETATFATTGSQTEVGNSKNAYTLTWDGTAKETNYTVSDSVGTLKVTEQSIIPGPDPENPVPNYKGIKIDDPSDVPYDGKEHKWTPTVTDAKDNKLTEGTDYEVSYNKKDYTNVTGAIEVTITGKGNYTGSVTKSYQITPASVSIKTNGAERVYNGKPLTADGKIEGLVNNETVDFKVTGSQTEVGNSKNTYTLKWTGTAKKSNYQIVSKEIGTLVVTENAKEIVVTTTGGTFTYTGHAHGATVTVSKLPEGYTLETAESSATATDVTKLPVKATADKLVIRNAQGKDVTDKLKITKIDGTIKVTPAALTITTPRAEKVYDGNALTAEGSITGFVNGETATFITTGSQTEVGNSKNTYTLTWDGTAKETNYTVSDSVGTLKVTKQSIVPDPNNPESYKDVTIDNPSDATYDGKEHKWTPGVKDKDGNELKEGTDYEVSYSKDDFTNVTGEIKVTITGKGNYTGTVDKTYQITPKAVIITTDSDTRAFNDQPLTAPGRVDGIVAGETYEFTVTGTQTYVGSSANSYQMTWAKKGENKYTAKKSNYKVEENIGTLTVTDGTPENPVTPSLVVNKTHDTDKTYKAGDVITFTITVKNIYDEAKTITLEEQEGVTLDKTTFENVKPGKEITAAATYTVTEADIVNGTFTNNVKATFSGVDKEYTGTDTVDKFEESNPHMTITKTTKNADADHIYKLGETIQYVITVENDGNLTLTNVKIEDALTGNAGENAWTIDTFAPGETQTFEASYVVTEADVIAGKVVNNATGEAENPDPKKEETPVTPGEKEDPVETPNPGLTVIKTSDKTGEVKLGDKITYTITVTNNGNVTISGVKLEDSLTGDDWTLGNIKPGETVTKKTTYTVTEKDIIAGKVENHATATGKEPGGKDITGEGEKTVTTEESNPQITVTKETTSTPKNGKTYALGEKITYKITAKNTGNLTLTDVTVSDELTGNTGDKAFKIDGNFKPGEEATFEASYTVKESDLGKTVVNEATAAGKTTDPKNPEPGVTPGTTEDPVDQKNPAMTITKKVTDKKEEYQIGDTVKYEITVKNTGNTTQNNVLVEDRMNAAGSAVITKVEGAKGTIDGANVTLDTLAPGKEATITAEYTVVKEDRGNTITNAAVAKGEGETPVTPEVPVDVEDVYDIHVTHVFADGEESSAALPEDYDIENLKPGTTKLLNAEEVSGYTAYPAAERVTIEEEDVTVTFVYYKDAIGTDPANPDQPDNIPDRYQAVVKFEAVNGTVNIDHAVVTLFDENNEPAENGVGHLTLLQIANATADAGYDQSSLSWAPETPTIRYEITGEMTFTASFTATPATPGTTPVNPANPTPATPSTPANPAPSTPSAPANQTPARSTNIITRAAEAIADGAERIASDVREVLNNDDEDVPLAKQKLDDHKCCILHFLIMLLAAILYGFYTHNMKKRQKKMFEAREELDLELARRGLPTTKEQEQM